MKYILIFVLLFLSLHAEVEKKQMYAKVLSDVANLYSIPDKNGEKKFNYFKNGDMIPIEYCDKTSWCKTVNGYVEKNLLRIPEPILKNSVVMPRYKTQIIKVVQSEQVVQRAQKTAPSNSPTIIDNNTPTIQKYATITSTHADLYNIPNQDAQKKEDYFKEGDTIGILYCDKSTWCKTSTGYVKKEFLSLLEPKIVKVLEPATPKVSTPSKPVFAMTPHGFQIESESAVTDGEYVVPPLLSQDVAKTRASVPSIEAPRVIHPVVENQVETDDGIYARLLPIKADLYYDVGNSAKKSIDYFHKGDRVKIEYCDNDKWCKTTNGFIQQDDIILSNVLMLEARALNKKELQSDMQYVQKRTIIPVNKVHESGKQLIVTKTKYIQIVKDVGTYEEYFNNDSAKVIFTKDK